MSGLRAYHPFPVSPDATAIALSPSESAHLVRSLRAREGEPVQLFDGQGRRWNGTVASADARALVARVTSREELAPQTPSLALAQALPKGGLMDDIIRAAVEIGAAEIFPLFSEHCEMRLDAERAATRLERWNTLAIEACKQSGNPFLPRIAAPVPLEKWLARPMPDTLLLVASLEPGAQPLARLTFGGAARLLLLVGPEGDFSPKEYALIREHGARAVRFGENVLRVPTAATYGLSALDQLRQRG